MYLCVNKYKLHVQLVHILGLNNVRQLFCIPHNIYNSHVIGLLIPMRIIKLPCIVKWSLLVRNGCKEFIY